MILTLEKKKNRVKSRNDKELGTRVGQFHQQFILIRKS